MMFSDPTLTVGGKRKREYLAKITSKWSKSLDWGEILLGHAVAMSHAVNSRAPENKPEFAAQATFALARRPDVRLECALTFTYIRNASWISGLATSATYHPAFATTLVRLDQQHCSNRSKLTFSRRTMPLTSKPPPASKSNTLPRMKTSGTGKSMKNLLFQFLGIGTPEEELPPVGLGPRNTRNLAAPQVVPKLPPQPTVTR